MMSRPKQILTMGVCGSGKTVLAQALSKHLGWVFLEGDDFHPQSNIEKMARGTPLTDADRMPWLNAIAGALAAHCRDGRSVVLSCSALKKAYRDILRDSGYPMTVVWLEAGADLLRQRLLDRRGHFMPASLIDSQLAALETPSASENALRLDARAGTQAHVAAVLQFLETPQP